METTPQHEPLLTPPFTPATTTDTPCFFISIQRLDRTVAKSSTSGQPAQAAAHDLVIPLYMLLQQHNCGPSPIIRSSCHKYSQSLQLPHHWCVQGIMTSSDAIMQSVGHFGSLLIPPWVLVLLSDMHLSLTGHHKRLVTRLSLLVADHCPSVYSLDCFLLAAGTQVHPAVAGGDGADWCCRDEVLWRKQPAQQGGIGESHFGESHCGESHCGESHFTFRRAKALD